MRFKSLFPSSKIASHCLHAHCQFRGENNPFFQNEIFSEVRALKSIYNFFLSTHPLEETRDANSKSKQAISYDVTYSYKHKNQRQLHTRDLISFDADIQKWYWNTRCYMHYASIESFERWVAFENEVSYILILLMYQGPLPRGKVKVGYYLAGKSRRQWMSCFVRNWRKLGTQLSGENELILYCQKIYI